MTNATEGDGRAPRNAVMGGVVAAAIAATLLAINGYEAWMTTRHVQAMRQCMAENGDRKACMERVRAEAPLPQPRRISTW